MKMPLIPLFFLLFLTFSCNSPSKKTQEENTDSLFLQPHIDSSSEVNPIDEILKEIPENILPVFGYRFVVLGDFDGDGKKENLIEHFISLHDNKETNKFYEGLSDQAHLVALTIKKNPYSFVTSDNPHIDTLAISSGGQVLGLAYLKNEGDLNRDETDEVSYVVNWADWSSLNTWHIMTYKNKKWNELYSFPIWDWQIPDLPETFNQYGLFGLENTYINTSNDTINKQLEKELKAYEGLVKKLEKNKIQVVYRNSEAIEDTIVVDLTHLKGVN